MNCNCKNLEIGVALVVLVCELVFWPAAWASWVVVAAAVLLFIHALKCSNCGPCPSCDSMPMKKTETSMKAAAPKKVKKTTRKKKKK